MIIPENKGAYNHELHSGNLLTQKKLSLSSPWEVYREQYGEYANWC